MRGTGVGLVAILLAAFSACGGEPQPQAEESATIRDALTGRPGGARRGPPDITIQPAAFAFPDTAVGSESTAQTFVVAGGAAGPRARCGRGGVMVALEGDDADQFRVVSQTCRRRPHAFHSGCSVVVAFAPGSAGSKQAVLRARDEGGRTGVAALSGTAGGTLALLAGEPGGIGFADGTGTAARFGLAGPAGMASDGAGNIYVADTHNHIIRRVEVATGVVTTVLGAPGEDGADDGPVAVARLKYPGDVTLDGAGNLFIADTGNYRIRRFALDTGEVSTVAGGPPGNAGTDGIGLAASFRWPAKLTADTAGNLYVLDGNCIRKIVTATAAVSTLAGQLFFPGSVDGFGTDARFSMPQGLAVDGDTRLYVADTSNHTVRQIDLATGEVTTLAGSPGVLGFSDGVGGAAQFYWPIDVTSDGAGNLYVADMLNHAVRRVALASGAVTTVVGSVGIETGVLTGPLPARLSQPDHVLALSPGALVITDERAMLLARF